MSTHPLADARYVSFTTFRRNGDPVAVAVWFAELPDGSFGFTTGGDSWKVKRLRNDPRVRVQRSDVRGRVQPGAVVHEGTAAVIDGSDPRFREIERAIAAKYGFMYRMVQLSGWVQGLVRRSSAGDAAIRVSLPRD